MLGQTRSVTCVLLRDQFWFTFSFKASDQLEGKSSLDSDAAGYEQVVFIIDCRVATASLYFLQPAIWQTAKSSSNV